MSTKYDGGLVELSTPCLFIPVALLSTCVLLLLFDVSLLLASYKPLIQHFGHHTFKIDSANYRVQIFLIKKTNRSHFQVDIFMMIKKLALAMLSSTYSADLMVNAILLKSIASTCNL